MLLLAPHIIADPVPGDSSGSDNIDALEAAKYGTGARGYPLRGGDYGGSYAPEYHPANTRTVQPVTPPLAYRPMTPIESVVAALAPLTPAPVAAVAASLTSSTPANANTAAAAQLGSGFVVKRDPNDVGGLQIAPTVYTAPSAVSDGGNSPRTPTGVLPVMSQPGASSSAQSGTTSSGAVAGPPIALLVAAAVAAFLLLG